MTDATFALRPKVRSHLYLVSLHDDSLTPARARKEREGDGGRCRESTFIGSIGFRIRNHPRDDLNHNPRCSGFKFGIIKELTIQMSRFRPRIIIMGWNQFCYCPLGSSIPIEPAPMVMGAPMGGPMTIGAGSVE